MSIPSQLPRNVLATGRESAAQVARRSRLVGSLKPPVQFVAFWAAIALPFAHLGLLAQGIESAGALTLFLGLLGLNLVALYVGHGYNQG